MKEWKRILGTNYEASLQGEIRSLVDNFGKRRKRILKPLTPKTSRYSLVNLHIGGKQKSHGIHRLVLLAFRGAPLTKKHQAAHLDGNPRNNKLTNLIWATPKENNHHKRQHGTLLQGERSPNAKYSSALVLQIRDLYAQGVARKDICILLNLPVSFIKDVRSGKSWSHI